MAADSRSLTSTARPTSLRLAGFLAVAAGATLVGVGATLPWISAGIGSDEAGVLTGEIRGLDLIDGIVALVLAVGALIAMLAARVVAPGPARRTIALAILLSGLVVAGLAAYDLAAAESRFEAVRVDTLTEDVVERFGLSEENARAQVEEALSSLGAFTRVEVGLWTTLAGGVVLALGGWLCLAWARGAEARPTQTPASAMESSASSAETSAPGTETSAPGTDPVP